VDRTICVLHLSDLHFSGSSDADSKIVIDALVKDIEGERKSGTTIDFIVFSGDLVKAGKDRRAFDEARKNFIDRVIAAAGISPDRFVSCPGNHDIDREIVEKDAWIEAGLLSFLKTKHVINKFVDEHSTATLSGNMPGPFKRLNNFYEKEWCTAAKDALLSTPFVLAFVFAIEDQKIGIACFNSAWRATGAPDGADQGNIIIGERAIDQAAAVLKDATLKIGVFHHPLGWLHDSDQAAVESRLNAEFDILMFGHVHRASPEKRLTISGEIILSQGACLYSSRDYFNGYNVIKVSPTAGSVEIHIMEYSDTRREFSPATRLLKDPILNFELPARGQRDISTLAGALLRARPKIRSLANQHISLVSGQGEQPLDIDAHYVCPGLRRGQTIELNRDEKVTAAEETAHALAEAKSLVIVGSPESGKTSLGHYLAVCTASGNADQARLPLFGNFIDLKKGERPFWRLVRNYANEISDGSLTRTALESMPLLVLVDDVDPLDAQRLTLLKELIERHKNVRWVLLTNSLPGGLSFSAVVSEHLPNFEFYSIRELSRQSIRALSATWLPSGGSTDRADALYRAVMEQIQRAGLPRNGYIVSLVLWAIKNKSSGELLNEAVLIQNIIDYMLGRMDYTGALRSELDFTTKSAILQFLAWHFKSTAEVHEKNDVLNVLIGWLDKKGLRFDAANLLNSFVACGVLDELGESVSFRFLRFQEFFVAGHLRDNPDLLRDVLANRLLEFRRELDLFTSRYRHESTLLEVGRDFLKQVPVSEPGLNAQTLEAYLKSTQRADFSNAQLRQMRKERMTADQIDELLDRTERRVAEKSATERKKQEDAGVDRSSAVIQYHEALELYSQLIRNLEFVDKDKKEEHLRECFFAWDRSLRAALSILQEAISDIRTEVLEKGFKLRESFKRRCSQGRRFS
jgi:predicted MPP superfamily phosphohydrolase